MNPFLLEKPKRHKNAPSNQWKSKPLDFCLTKSLRTIKTDSIMIRLIPSTFISVQHNPSVHSHPGHPINTLLYPI